MQDRVDRIVQKVAVVADDDHRARIARDMVLKPERAFEIEIVGRLVEQQQVGLGEQGGGERHPHAPAAGEFGARALLFGMRKAQARKDFGGARRRRMGADVGEPGLDFRDPVRIVRGLALRQEAASRSSSALSTISSRLSGPSGASCASRADARSRRTHDIAVLGRDLTHDGAEQRGLAGAVAADEPDARAVRNARGGVFQQKLAGHAQR